MNLFDKMMLLSMNKREPTMAGRIAGCSMFLTGACISTYCAVTLPGFRAFFIICAGVMFLIAAGVIIANVIKNRM